MTYLDSPTLLLKALAEQELSHGIEMAKIADDADYIKALRCSLNAALARCEHLQSLNDSLMAACDEQRAVITFLARGGQ